MDNKQIEEMAEEIQRYVLKRDSAIVLNFTIGGQHKRGIAEHLIKKGYRKERQGEWITDKYTEAIYCSVCNGLAPVDCEKEKFFKSDYCPDCGARMKGE